MVVRRSVLFGGPAGAALLVSLLLLGTNALATARNAVQSVEKITFTSRPPRPAIAGGRYAVSARSASGRAVQLFPTGACSFDGRHQANFEKSVSDLSALAPPPRSESSPETVHFVAAGNCTITASLQGKRGPTGSPESSGFRQSFAVLRDPSDRITFTSTPPSDATVGSSYNPSARSSAGLEIFFSSATPHVCAITFGPLATRLDLIAPGTCIIDASQTLSRPNKRPRHAPDAQQSFTVSSRARPRV